MSDYLGHLAARSLDPVPAVRPRLASRFEPRPPALPPLAAGPAVEPVLVEESVEVPAPPLRPRRNRRRAVKTAEPVAERTVEAGVDTGVEVVEAPPVKAQRGGGRRREMPSEASPPGPLSSGAGEGERFRTAPPVQPAALGQALRVGSPSPAPPAAPGTALRTGPPSPVRERGTGGEASRADRPAHAQPPGALQPALPAPASSALQPSRESLRGNPPRMGPPSPAPLERGSGGEVSRADRSIHEPPRSPLKPAVSDLAPLQPRITVVERVPVPVRAEAPAPEPVIQISIGRIEVRATPPPAQPARPRPAAHAAMSLEEYLRRRSRRGDG